jgi:hypothetical protein
MVLKTLIISSILVAFVFLALAVKLLFRKDTEITAHSCAIEDEQQDKDEACSICQLKDLIDCPEDYKNLKSENKSEIV